MVEQGQFVIELYYQHAPRTCFNIAELARIGYYNDTKFHRVIRVSDASGCRRVMQIG